MIPREPRRVPSDLVLFVDRIACDGYGTCAELLPELITLDEWGYPIIRNEIIAPELVAHARAAVDGCPVLALRLADPGRVTIGAAPARPRPAQQPTRAAIAGRAAREARQAREQRRRG
jgi:ferredoxin